MFSLGACHYCCTHVGHVAAYKCGDSLEKVVGVEWDSGLGSSCQWCSFLESNILVQKQVVYCELVGFAERGSRYGKSNEVSVDRNDYHKKRGVCNTRSAPNMFSCKCLA